MNKHWAAALIGLPWSPEFNCWELVRMVFKERLGIELPAQAAGVLILAGAAHTTGLRPAEDGQARADDLVLMRQRDGRRHVGVMVQANGKLGVLHNDGHLTPGGPVGCVGFTSVPDLARAGMRQFEFWRRA